MNKNLRKKIIFTYDDESKVWISQVQGVEELNGIILEGVSLVTLAQRMELAIKEMIELLDMESNDFPV